jgi:hypothetical protein
MEWSKMQMQGSKDFDRAQTSLHQIMAHSSHVFGVMEAFGRMKVATTLLDEITVLLRVRLVWSSKSADEGGVECFWTALGSFGCSSYPCSEQERLCASADRRTRYACSEPLGWVCVSHGLWF